VRASISGLSRTAVRLCLTLVPVLSAAPGQAQSPERARTLPGRNQLAIDGGGPLTWSVSYVHRIGNGPFGLGGGAGFGWELNANNLHRHIWNAGYVDGIVRYEPAPFLQLEAGPTLLGYSYADDCSQCGGTFVGARVGAGIGYKPVYVGADVRLGRAVDDRHGPRFGAILTPRVRVAVSWGR
jgi:hypothetical protein